MNIIYTFCTQKIIRHNKFQMSFIYKLVLKQDFDNKLMINEITFSMLGYPSTSHYDDIYNGVYKSTFYNLQ